MKLSQCCKISSFPWLFTWGDIWSGSGGLLLLWGSAYPHPHGCVDKNLLAPPWGADKNWGGVIVIVRDSCIVTVRDVKRDIVTLSLKWPVAILEASKSCWQVQRTWKRRNANFLDWWKSHGFEKSDNSWKLKLNFTFWHENTKVQKYENHLTRNYKIWILHLLPDRLRQTKSPEAMKPSSVWETKLNQCFTFQWWISDAPVVKKLERIQIASKSNPTLNSSFQWSLLRGGWIVAEMNSSPKMSHLLSASSDIYPPSII